MAQRVEVRMIDDVDQGPADETVEFGLDGVEYAIDLSSSNAQQLRESLAPWVQHGRRLRGRQGRAASSRSNGSAGPSASDVRAWAAEQGIELSSRGRIPAEVRQAYADAH